jgi:HNH/ENDO VII superfamily nuclease
MQWQRLYKGNWKPFLKQEIHHFATNKHGLFTKPMEGIAGRYGLSLDGSWNKALMPHAGRHTHAYHRMVLQQMRNAHNIAKGNVATFIEHFNENVVKPVLNDPSQMYK